MKKEIYKSQALEILEELQKQMTETIKYIKKEDSCSAGATSKLIDIFELNKKDLYDAADEFTEEIKAEKKYKSSLQMK